MCAVDLSLQENAVKHIDRKEIGNYNTQRLKRKGFGKNDLYNKQLCSHVLFILELKIHGKVDRHSYYK